MLNKTKEICEMIQAFNVPGKYRGYDYTVTAMLIYMKKETRFSKNEGNLFEQVAAIHHCKRENVYRDMQTFCKEAWKHNPELMQSLSDVPLADRPSVSEFVHLLANPLMREKPADTVK